MRRKIDQHLHHLRRPSYYETERARRLGLTEQRRRIRQRTTINARPDAGQLREAFIHARDSVGNMIRLGSLMEDLECYIDNSLIFGEDGKIVASEKKTVTLPPDSSVAVGDFRSLTVNHCSQATFLVLTLNTPLGEFQNDWHFGFYKDMPLVNANIDITAGRVVPDALRRHEDMPPYRVDSPKMVHQITLSTDKPAFFVWANVRGVCGEFDDNAFTLLPGRPKTLCFMPKRSMTPDEFRKALSVTNLE